MRGYKAYSLEDYLITKEGEIYNKHNNHKLKPQPNGKGYLRVIIGHKRYFVHRLVAQLYVPNPQNKLQVNHIDGNKLNNNANNLEWVTNQENRDHAVKNRLHSYGEKNHSKLKEKDVLYIKQHMDFSANKLAEKFNVSARAIRTIWSGRSWKWLKSYAELSQIESDRNKG